MSTTQRQTKRTASRPIAILLVDDDPDCRLLTREAIGQGRLECEVHEVGSGEAALEFLRRSGPYARAPRPALVYMDVEMPGMGGLEALRRIKADEGLRDIPVVMMTGVDNDEHKRRAAAWGANSYTLKPIDPKAFLQTVLTATNYWLCIHQFPEPSGSAAA